MDTALDTNILSAIWTNKPEAGKMADRLAAAQQEGQLIVCGVVYAELLAFPGASAQFVNDFLADTEVRIDFGFDELLWREAGRRFAVYAERRRVSNGGKPKRLLADFLVGAHALHRAGMIHGPILILTT